MSNSPSPSDHQPSANLVPQQYELSGGRVLHYFVSSNLPLVKLDLTFEAGTCYQDKKCQAAAANQLLCKASARHTAAEVAEFLDFRGIIVEHNIDVCTGCITVYFLRNYADELFPLLRELLEEPVVDEQAFAAHVAKRRMQLQSGQQKTSVRARNAFYEALYGADHPLGSHAEPEDVDQLSIDDVRRFIRYRYRLSQASIVVGGDVDEELLEWGNRLFPGPSLEGGEWNEIGGVIGVGGVGGVGEVQKFRSSEVQTNDGREPLELGTRNLGLGVCDSGLGVCDLGLGARNLEMVSVPSAVQSTIRVGRRIPFAWDSEECALFSVLNTVLGGYFGSRLMTNLREDKGYTYGIYSQMQVYRGTIVFYITADVAAESTASALQEIRAELERLRTEPVGEEELQRVCSYMRGDYLRSIDGIFEISERYRQMTATGCDERITQRLLEAIDTATPKQLQQLAEEMFAPECLTTVVAGAPAAHLKFEI